MNEFFYIAHKKLPHKALRVHSASVCVSCRQVYACGRQKKLTMPAYCVAANCTRQFADDPRYNNARAPRNRPAVRRKWIKFIQFKRADFLAAPHHAHLCREHFSECDFANPMEYRMGFASKLTRCSGTLSKYSLTDSNWYGCILVGLSGKVSVSSSELELAILQRLPRVTE